MKKRILITFLVVAMAVTQLPILSTFAQEQEIQKKEEILEEAGTEKEERVATGVNVEYHTQEEIKEYIQKNPIIQADVSFDVEPVITPPYQTGSLSQSILDSSLNMLNQIRYIAGISYNVALSEEYNTLTQAAAFINLVNNKMSHYPDKPEGMEDSLYQQAYTGASSSNIAWGSGIWAKRTIDQMLVQCWMEDGDDGNISRVGHRRWILNPSMGKVGFGMATKNDLTHYAMYAFDKSNTQAQEFGVMWPAQNMPVEYFGDIFPWSISIGSPQELSEITVTLTRKNDGKIWSFSQESADGYFNIDNTYRGQQGCIIFRPDMESIGGYQAGDVYQVEIQGVSSGDISYEVNFFDLYPKNDTENSEESDSAKVEEVIPEGEEENTNNNTNSTDSNTAGEFDHIEKETNNLNENKNPDLQENIENESSMNTEHGSQNESVSHVENNHYTGNMPLQENISNSEITTLPTEEQGSDNNTGKQTPAETKPVLKKGSIHTIGIGKYKVTGTNTLSFFRLANSKAKKVTIPKTVKINGIVCKVTSISQKAFQGKKITSVTIGANITSIGKNAFQNCKQLKKVVIRSKKLKSIGKNAFCGIRKKAKIKVPKKNLSTYKKLLKNKGQGKQVKITK